MIVFVALITITTIIMIFLGMTIPGIFSGSGGGG